MKCLKCNNEAKWCSLDLPSPLCSKCARKVVDDLISKGLGSADETATVDFYTPISISYRGGRANYNPDTGEISYDYIKYS